MAEPLTINIKYFADISPLKFHALGDWIDLRCAETTVIHEGEYALIPLGVAMQLPEGYEAMIVPRSSTFQKYGIIMANNVGVVDHTYCGNDDEWHFPAYAFRDTVIPFDDRICQFRIVQRQPKLYFRTVLELNAPNRGGFGSTGYK